MKKPKKPKAKRPMQPPTGAASASGRGHTPELGAAALAFLRHGPQPIDRAGGSGSGASVKQRIARRDSGPERLGPAARAFIRRPTASHPRKLATGTLTDVFDQRQIVTLLLLPFFLLAFALSMSQTWRHPVRLAEPPTVSPSVVAIPQPTPPAAQARAPAAAPIVEIALPPALRLPPSAPTIVTPDIQLAAPTMTLPAEPPEIVTPQIALAPPDFNLPRTPPAITLPIVSTPVPNLALPAGPPAIEVFELGLAAPSTRVRDRLPPVEPEQRANLALLPPLPSPDASLPTSDLRICPASPGFGQHTYAVRAVAPGENFGERLAGAARAQVGTLVIYNDKYIPIAYPMGDVPPMFGVCTDVIIRAYRAVGIDLQVLVAKARIGSGDTSIQHRRTETLRRFFASRGVSLPVTSFPENYQPGDIVTYYRPQNRRSRAHIAVVSDVIAPSGRPMIVHNRGWGPQLEDALFVDKITGHYRFHPAPTSLPQVASAAAPAHATRKGTSQSSPISVQRAAYSTAKSGTP